MLHCDRLVVASTRWPFDVGAIHKDGVVGLAHFAGPLEVSQVHLSRDRLPIDSGDITPLS